MPNKKDTLLIEGKHVPKRHLLCSKLELFKKFKAIYQDFNGKFPTFKKMFPIYYRRLDLTCRRVCVCTKDYNFEQKVEALNRLLPDLKATSKQLSDLSICPFKGIPKRQCVDRKCQHCGIEAVTNHYMPLLKSPTKDKPVKYYQWESVKESYFCKDGKGSPHVGYKLKNRPVP